MFCNFLLADEINRAPAKVQSALLEVMQERQVTIGHNTYPVPDPFLVLATQNPIESEGTYPLPEAQVDRFMLKVLVDYPAHDEELTVVAALARAGARRSSRCSRSSELKALQAKVGKVYVDPALISWVVDLATATRKPAEHGSTAIAPYISYGASPRGPISVVARGARPRGAARARLRAAGRRRGGRPRRVPAPPRALLPGARGGGHRRPGARPGAGRVRSAADRPRPPRLRVGVKGLVAAVGRERTPARPGPGPITAESLEALELAIGRRVDGLLAGDYRSAFAGRRHRALPGAARTRPATTSAGSTGTSPRAPGRRTSASSSPSACS